VRVHVAVVLGHLWRGNRLGLTCHSATSKFSSLFSRTVEEAFFVMVAQFF
jgi:hypothetical protein